MSIRSKEKEINKWDNNVPVEKSNYTYHDEFKIIKSNSVTVENGELTMIDLFSGAGGFSVGCSWAGFQSIMGIDYFEPAIQTWSYNHPKAVAILGDIKKVEAEEIKKLLPNIKEIDLITGGVPCQGFSLANRKHNTEDERNYLFLDFMRIVKELSPKAIIIENVSAIRSRGDGKFEKEILQSFSEAGYKGVVQTLNAADYGVPQIRERVFFVGLRNGKKFEFPKPKFSNFNKISLFDKPLKPYRTVKDAISDLPPLRSHENSDKYDDSSVNLLEFQKMMRGVTKELEKKECLELFNHVAPKHDNATLERIKRTEQGMPMYEKFKQRIRLKFDKPSPTQLAGGIRPQFQFGHPEQIRGLTVRERARIQSFPDSYKFLGGTVQERVQTGNAVPPLLVYEIVKELKKYL